MVPSNEQWDWIAQVIANMGFPAVITFFLLASFQKRIDRLNVKLTELMQLIRDGRKR
ncbi:YvrJ family protein [Ferviditalea candida]|uniref:YvrJ family protein n=1 Tax=Ferviditalea candida TaxID=3108399 RepID=A0ABU5ZCG7_9BACL|nr:YvrJ family protein [Paenibacillaceae bacterium T2]